MPIYATSTYVQQSPACTRATTTRASQNPTRMAFERCIADLEGGSAGFAFASGLAAIATVLECLDQGAHVVADRRSLRRHAPAVRAGAQALGRARGDLRRPDRSPTRSKRRSGPNTQADLGRDADQSAAQARRSRARRRDRAQARHPGASPTTPSPAPTSSGRSNSASTSSCIRPPSISTAIPTWSAASRWSATNAELRERLDVPAERGRRHPGAVRLLPRAARPQDAGAAHGAALRLRAADRRNGWRRHPKVRARVSIPACRAIRSTRSRKRQMRAFGGMISVELDGDLAGATRFLERCRAVRARREPRRRREPDRASGAHDARLDPGRRCAPRSASATRWCGSRSASRTSTT